MEVEYKLSNSYLFPYVVRININPLMPIGNYSCQFNICCPRDCVSRHNGGTSGAPLKPLRVDSVLRELSTLRGLRGAPEAPPLCRDTQSLGQKMLNATVGINGLNPSQTAVRLMSVAFPVEPTTHKNMRRKHMKKKYRKK